jgi:hypothetical protein
MGVIVNRALDWTPIRLGCPPPSVIGLRGTEGDGRRRMTAGEPQWPAR